jgi:hypothetical protein
MHLKNICAVVLAIGMGACSSPKSTSSPKLDDSVISGAAFTQTLPFTQAEFIDAVSAFVRRIAPEIKAHGYTVVFLDIGPDSLEKQAPDCFLELAQRSSAEGVQVRGYSRIREETKAFHDKQTGEPGVMLSVHGFAKKAEGRFLILGEWIASPPAAGVVAHTVLHTMVNDGGIWKAL